MATIHRIGSRGSALALAQAELAAAALAEAARRHGIAFRYEIVVVQTSGDRNREGAFEDIGPKGIFARELQAAVAAGEVDLAIHSMKDLEADEPEGLAIGAVLRRGEPGDALVARDGLVLADLPGGARVGTSSLRRRALISMTRPDLEVVPLRGNVDTRLTKVASGDVDAAVLAAAGLVRLGRATSATEWLDPRTFLPAPGQGIIAIEAARSRLAAGLAWIREAEDQATRVAADVEMSFMRIMEGGCRVPMGCWARREEDETLCEAFVSLPDGTRAVRGRVTGPPDSGAELGVRLAEQMLEQGAMDVVAALRE